MKLTKVGQFPSLAGLSLPDIDKYNPILTVEERGDFGRAVGLHAHSVGIGSFVYFRRIFEGLIEKTHTKLLSTAEWHEDALVRSRMDEKIKLLSSALLYVVVENSDMYSMLSKGIHELSEQECFRYFDILRAGIEMILGEELADLEKSKQGDILSKAISF